MSATYAEMLNGAPLARRAPGARHELICGRLHKWMKASVANFSGTRLLAPRSRVQLAHHLEQFFGGDRVGRGDGFRVDSKLGAGLDFVTNVNLGAGVVARQDYCQPRRTALGGQLLHARL